MLHTIKGSCFSKITSYELSLRGKNKPGTALPSIIIGLSIVVALVGILFWYVPKRSVDSDADGVEETKKAPSLVTTPQPKVSFEKNYTSKLGFYFEYPEGWSVETFTVQKGENLKRADRYDINANNADVEVVDIVNGVWTIEITATKGMLDQSSGMGPIFGDSLKASIYFKIADQDAARVDLEQGNFWTVADQNGVYPTPIIFPVDAQLSQEVRKKLDITGDAYQFRWNPTSPKGDLLISITYYSDEFTETNIREKKLDYSILSEMDNILKTFKFL